MANRLLQQGSIISMGTFIPSMIKSYIVESVTQSLALKEILCIEICMHVLWRDNSLHVDTIALFFILAL